MGIHKKRILIIGVLPPHLLSTCLSNNIEIVTLEDLEVQKQEELKFKYERIDMDFDFHEKIHLNKLHEHHPFSKFMGNKKKKW
jgi:hypothetical protein